MHGSFCAYASPDRFGECTDQICGVQWLLQVLRTKVLQKFALPVNLPTFEKHGKKLLSKCHVMRTEANFQFRGPRLF